jgi:hypothetical protein
MVVPPGKFPVCNTDTFRNYAIVIEAGKGIVAIDRQGIVLYSVFVFDNGPDDPADGLFRIWMNGKLGYADAADRSTEKRIGLLQFTDGNSITIDPRIQVFQARKFDAAWQPK